MDAKSTESRMLKTLRRRRRHKDALIYSTASLARDLRVSRREALEALTSLHGQRLAACLQTSNSGLCWRYPVYGPDLLPLAKDVGRG